MNALRLVIVLSLTAALSPLGCAKRKNKPAETKSEIAPLCEKAERYKTYLQDNLDSFGWASPKCDGLLFNSLLATSGFPVNIYAAEESPGRWRRHPDFDWCRPHNGSRSTISKDMFRGLFIYLLTVGDRAAMRRIEDYGKEKGWVMGEAQDPESYWGRVVMPPSLSYQLSRMITRSPDAGVETVQKPDFEGHLEVLGIYTEALIYGAITDRQLSRFRDYAREFPDNGLYQAFYARYSSGEMERAVSAGMNETWFPSWRLPEDTDRYTHYIWQRSGVPEDWTPCGSSGKRPCEGVRHSGIDLIFLAHVAGC